MVLACGRTKILSQKAPVQPYFPYLHMEARAVVTLFQPRPGARLGAWRRPAWACCVRAWDPGREGGRGLPALHPGCRGCVRGGARRSRAVVRFSQHNQCTLRTPPPLHAVGVVNKIGRDFLGLLVAGVVNVAVPVARVRKDLVSRPADHCWASQRHPDHTISVGTHVVFDVTRCGAGAEGGAM